jgi:transcriptional regulator with XRE-family HTH domain
MTSNNTNVIVPTMATKKRVDYTHDEVLAILKADDPEFARVWDQGTFARIVAGELIGYRGRNGLSQHQLAELIGVKQPQIARWERGETLPNPQNLARIAGKLNIELVFSYTPAGTKAKLLTKTALDHAETYEEHNAIVRIATSPTT